MAAFRKIAVALAALSLALFAVGGSAAFSSIGLLIASRAKNGVVAGALGNLINYPSLLFCGVFFPVSRFPEVFQPVIHALPLTAVNDGMRAILMDGQPLLAVWREALVLGAWALGAFAVSLKAFRWV